MAEVEFEMSQVDWGSMPDVAQVFAVWQFEARAVRRMMSLDGNITTAVSRCPGLIAIRIDASSQDIPRPMGVPGRLEAPAVPEAPATPALVLRIGPAPAAASAGQGSGARGRGASVVARGRGEGEASSVTSSGRGRGDGGSTRGRGVSPSSSKDRRSIR